MGGAAKNVYAIACGVVEGMGLGENAREFAAALREREGREEDPGAAQVLARLLDRLVSVETTAG